MRIGVLFLYGQKKINFWPKTLFNQPNDNHINMFIVASPNPVIDKENCKLIKLHSYWLYVNYISL